VGVLSPQSLAGRFLRIELKMVFLDYENIAGNRKNAE